MIAAIERGKEDDFKDSKPRKTTDKKIIKGKDVRTKKHMIKTKG